MTGVLSTQQEVARQTVCFALILKLDLNGFRESQTEKESEREREDEKDSEQCEQNSIY